MLELLSQISSFFKVYLIFMNIQLFDGAFSLRESFLKIWDAWTNSMGTEFMAVLEYHIGRRLKMPVREAIIRDPHKFKQVFQQVFGTLGWRLLIATLVRAAEKIGEDSKYVQLYLEIQDTEYIKRIKDYGK